MFGLGGLAKLAHARMLVGLHATDTTVQLDFRERGGSVAKQTGSDLITHLPGGTIAAADIGDPAGVVSAATKTMTTLFSGCESSVSSSSSGCAYAIAPPKPGTATPQPVRAAPPSCNATTTTTQTQSRIDPLAQIEKVTGLKLPGDAVTLLGSGAVVAYGGLSTSGLPNIAVRSRPADVSAAEAVAEKLRAAVDNSAHLDLAVRTSGSDLVVATSGDYADAVAGSGDLGSSPHFTDAMGDMPTGVAFAAYADLSKLLPLFDHGQRDLNHLEAVGVWAGSVGNDQVAQLRLVVD